MRLFIFSDESGVFDSTHNDYFVFAGVIYLSDFEKINAERLYLSAEKVIRKIENFDLSTELKATFVSNSSKSKLFRSLNKTQKFGVVIHQKQIHEEIFNDKKSKQRYLDYAFKIGIKRAFEALISSGVIIPEEVTHIHFYVDEHTTATNGKYELEEALEQEFKRGTFTQNWSKFFPPIFPEVKCLTVKYCNSEAITLVRAADIVANKLYYSVRKGKLSELQQRANFHIAKLP